MILVIKNGKVIAYHDDTQEYVLGRYSDCEFVQVNDDKVIFDENGWPLDPRVQEIECKNLLDITLLVDRMQINTGESVTVMVKSTPATDITIDLLIDGPPANELALTNGVGQEQYTLADPGKYLVEVIYGDIRKHLFVEVV